MCGSAIWTFLSVMTSLCGCSNATPSASDAAVVAPETVENSAGTLGDDERTAALRKLGAKVQSRLDSSRGRNSGQLILRSNQPARHEASQKFGITRKDYEAIVTTVPTVQREQAAPLRWSKAKAKRGALSMDVRLVGCPREYFLLRKLKLSAGRMFSRLHHSSRSRVAIVGSEVARRINHGNNPIGEQILVNVNQGNYFTIVGVIGDRSTSTAADIVTFGDDVGLDVYIPYSTWRASVGDITRTPGDPPAVENLELSQILIDVELASMHQTAEVIVALLDRFHSNQDYELIKAIGLPFQTRAEPDEVISIDLTGTKADDATLTELKKFRAVEVLKLRNSQITDEGLARIESLNRLKYLDLRGTRITSDGLAHLQKLTELRWLHLGDTQVGGEGLKHLEGLKQLRYFFVDGLQFNDDELDLFRNSRQQVYVVR
jgi:hypothetical protein